MVIPQNIADRENVAVDSRERGIAARVVELIAGETPGGSLGRAPHRLRARARGPNLSPLAANSATSNIRHTTTGMIRILLQGEFDRWRLA